MPGLKVYFPEVSLERPHFLGIGRWRLRNLKPITVLFGKNSSGKSLLLRAWRDGNVETSHYVIPERTGNLGFDSGYLLQQIEARERRNASQSNFMNEYRRQAIARVQAYFLTRGATRTGELPGDPGELETLASVLMPDFSIKLIGANPPYRLARAENDQIVGEISQISTGEAQVFTLGLDILTIAAIWDIQNKSQRLLLVDEPDAHLHPDLQVRFADFLVQVGRRFSLQIVVATHSTTLLAGLGQFAGEEAAIIYLDRTRDEFVGQSFTAALKELATCLGGHALMGPVFGVPLLLVEGDDDYRIWSQVPRHHVTSFAVIPCQGEEIKKYQKALERIFGSLRDAGQPPAGFALLDGDKAIPTPSPESPQQHVKFIQLNCREAENLYLTDESLARLGRNWNEAAARIREASSEFGEKAAKLACAPSWDRQREDLKEVINEVARILDTKNLHWTVRVGVAVGNAIPSGQLREFLGSQVLSVLWHES